MKTKTKIMAFVSLASLTMVLLVVGVWALKTVNFTVGGNLSYIAPGIEATISKGTLANGTWVNSADASTKMPLTQITRTDTEDSLEEKFSYWQDLNLTFNETGDDVTITFSITNNSTSKYILLDVSTSYASADNCTISINTTSATLDPKTSQQFVITMAVTDKTANATMTNFAVVFNMQLHTENIVETTEYPNLVFNVVDSNLKTVSVAANTSNKPTGQLVVPSKVLISGVEYTVIEVEECEWDDYYKNGGFANCTNLTKVYLPNTITTIGDGAFQNCSAMTSISLSKSLITIGYDAFYQSGLIYVSIPASVTNCGGGLFYSCSNLKGVVFNNNIETLLKSKNFVPGGMFDSCTSLSSYTIPDSVTSIGYRAFSGCTGLTSITIPDSVTSIGDFAFSNCTGLSSITIPDSVTSIGDYAFSDCKGLTSITIPDKVTSIGYQAFYNCTGLTSVTIGSGVTSIGFQAFYECTSLATVEVKATTPPTGGQYMFEDCHADLQIKVPSASVDLYRSATYWSGYADNIKAGSF